MIREHPWQSAKGNFLKWPFHRRESYRRDANAPARPAILSFGEAAKQATAEAGLPAIAQLSHHQSKINLMEHLIQEVASPRTYTLLKEYYKQSKVPYLSPFAFCTSLLVEYKNESG